MQNKVNASLKGIDISHYESVSDWNAVKGAGISFCYIKATEGTTMQDDKFESHVKGAQSVDILTGAYHFAHPEANDVQGEANNFIARLKDVPTDLVPVLDLEYPTDTSKISVADLVKWAGDFINLVKAATGTTVMVYTGNWFIDMYQDLWTAFTPYPLWISNYSNIDAPPDAGGWTKWVVWQYTDQGTIPGISGNVDLNIAESLDAITWPKKQTTFPDVPQDYWAEGSIAVAVNEGFMSAYDDGTFKPEAPVTRAQLAKVINEIVYKYGNK